MGDTNCSSGCVVGDYDGDGDPDLYVGNDAGANFYHENRGDSTFEDVSWVSGAVVSEHGEAEGSMGLTVGDYDNDGDADIVVVNKNDRPAVLRNDGGNGGSWLVIRPQGVESNRGGIGAKVYVEAGGTCRYFEFEVRGSDGYLPGNDLRIHAGLGTEEAADVEIHWHSGRRDFFRAVVVRRFYLATEGRGTRVDSPAAAARRP